MVKDRFSIVLCVMGYAVAFASIITLLFTFLYVTFYSNNYSVMVYTNLRGEHYIELVLICVGIFCLTYDVVRRFRISREVF